MFIAPLWCEKYVMLIFGAFFEQCLVVFCNAIPFSEMLKITIGAKKITLKSVLSY